MLFDKFTGGISQDDTHSNQYAAGTTSEQTFSQRKEIEQNRRTIAAYQHSAIGRNFAPHGEYVRSPRTYKKPESRASRQEMNANGGSVPERSESQISASRQAANARPQTFREPPTRGYNPYS
ncbi:MAG TPA: hypothetical protein VGE13_04280 [Candidatus Saccharimonadales bacterium]